MGDLMPPMRAPGHPDDAPPSRPGPAPRRVPVQARRLSLREQVTDALRAAVVSGEMKPGQVYSAPTLAARFGVSATPVREAMLDLAKQGLIEVVPNKGFQVTTVSEAELDQITELRLLLEPPTAEALAGQVSPEDAAGLVPFAEAIVEAAGAGDLITYIEADREFHGRLLGLGGNGRLVDIVYDLRDRTRLYGLAGLAEHGLLEHSAREHLTMCDLVAAGDGPALGQLMRDHISRVRREWAGKE